MKSKKQNNAGFSLIEIVLTIAILSIVFVPFLRSFFSAMFLNTESRHLQNATSVGQSIMEEVQAKDFRSISFKNSEGGVLAAKAEYYDKLGNKITPTIDPKTNKPKENCFPVYTLENVYMQGADGEDYYVDIKLDAREYSDISSAESDKKKNAVNSISSPEFSSLFGSDSMMILGQYTNPDNNLKEYFSNAGGFSEDQLNSLSPATVNKKTTMNIEGSYADGIYKYDITLIMVYSLKANPSKQVEVVKSTSKTYDSEDGHSIYFIMPVFDNQTAYDAANGEYYSSDALDVKYSFVGASGVKTPKLRLYIAGQETSYKGTTFITNVCHKLVKINGTQLYKYKNGTDFDVYTNIKDYDNYSDSIIQGLTYSDRIDESLLYAITVDVKYDDPEGDIVATFTSSKEE